MVWSGDTNLGGITALSGEGSSETRLVDLGEQQHFQDRESASSQVLVNLDLSYLPKNAQRLRNGLCISKEKDLVFNMNF